MYFIASPDTRRRMDITMATPSQENSRKRLAAILTKLELMIIPVFRTAIIIPKVMMEPQV